MNSVQVNRKAADRLASGHPWIFSSDVLSRGSAVPGEAVQVIDQRGRPLGTAHYSSTSQITLRLLSRKVEPIDRAFLKGRLEAAISFRNRIAADSPARRLVHGEADQLPGLIVDQYGDCLAVQALSQGMDAAIGDLVACLRELLSPRAIVARNDVSVRAHESLPVEKSVLYGEPPEPVAVAMNGLEWEIDLMHGQKTGIFLDQRENYLAAARHAHGRALDCFTSTGGFALHLARSCASVEAIDSSELAIATAARNAQRNGAENVTFREADVFEVLVHHAQARQRFGTIVLDPPAFAKARSSIPAAGRGYKEINLRALRLLDSGGILVTCSCSHHFTEAMLLETVAAAALDAGRTLRVLERRTQAQDHPILLTVPETHYLKCLILEVV
ncbi:MAG TPA: class I SAM-dependent rRNA methyltransferase [Bryobacteraceae bacterium]|nr:class I SAM-dependent rRNA methyltransferase [Bryobacteraceae bacterium]